MSTQGERHSNEDVRFEETDVATRPVALSVLGLAIFTVVFTFIGHLVFQGLAAREKASSPPPSPLAEKYAAKEPPAPRLQADPKKDLDILLAKEDRILGRLGWVDEGAGIAQVPIERAMQLFIASAPPARDRAVPWRMAPRGVAPSQAPEASGAPDWYWGTESGADGQDGHGVHGKSEGHGH